jgi:hypothetical protein
MFELDGGLTLSLYPRTELKLVASEEFGSVDEPDEAPVTTAQPGPVAVALSVTGLTHASTNIR